MPLIEYVSKPRIEIDGQELSPEVDVLLGSVVVSDDLHEPDMFVLRFRDDQRTVLSRSRIRIGSSVRILAAPMQGRAAVLHAGEATAIEGSYDRAGSHTVVRGYDHSHRLHRGRTTETHRDVTDADVVRLVARRAGLEIGQIDATSTVHPHLSRLNLTDWEFLAGRAVENGFELAVLDGRLHFRSPAVAADGPDTADLDSHAPEQLVLGANLETLAYRITAAEQVTDVEVRSWDPSAKEALVGTATANTSGAAPRHPTLQSPGDLATLFGGPSFVSAEIPLATQQEVDTLAGAIAERIASAFFEATGVAQGNPALRAGVNVSLGPSGEVFEGRYTLTACTHVFDQSGYKTTITISGRQRRSLLGAIGATNGRGRARHVSGVVPGIVTDVHDPLRQGRVKLIFPWLSDSYESDWVRMTQFGAGDERGAMFLPEIGDEVLVAFEQGDVRRPYVIGSLYNGVDSPVLGDGYLDGATSAVQRRGFVSKNGHKLVFFDDPSDSGVALLTDNEGLRIAMRESDSVIRVSSRGQVEIEGTGDVTIRSQGRLEISGDMGVAIDAGSAPVEIKGSQIRLN